MNAKLPLQTRTLTLALGLILASPLAMAFGERTLPPVPPNEKPKLPVIVPGSLVPTTLAFGERTLPPVLPNEKPKPQPMGITPVLDLKFAGFEDAAIHIDSAQLSGELALLLAPQHGSVLFDPKVTHYVPHSDFVGRDEMTLSMTGPGRVMTEVKVVTEVIGVNDAPVFTAGGGRAHPVKSSGNVTIAGWASELSAGPADEAATQAVWFDAQPLDEYPQVVTDVSVDPNGTLKYSLTGSAGVGAWAVTMHDSGGVANGGVDSSTTYLLEVGVGQSTDLAVKIVRGYGDGLIARGDYQVIVSNSGGLGVQGARVVDVLPADARSAEWSCAAFDGAKCSSAAGVGAIDERVNLPVGGMVVFAVGGVALAKPDGGHSAFVQPPDYVLDTEPSNNEAVEF